MSALVFPVATIFDAILIIDLRFYSGCESSCCVAI